jgi:hypothetical protein
MNARTLGPVFGFGLALVTAAAYADPSVDHPTITIWVEQGRIHLSEEDTAVVLPTESAVVWKLRDGSGYEFPKTGIVVASPPEVHACRVTDKGQGFRCNKLKHLAGKKYKYTVNLVATGSGQAPRPLDPFILHQP